MIDPRLSNHPFAAGQILAGRFRIVRQLGLGGMGAVFEVEHELTCHRRALKLLHPQMAEIPAVVERFLREASAAGRIGNTHIVETFDAGRLETGEPYIVMELLQGRTLADRLQRAGPLELARASDLMSQACDGVGAAHAAGIVHRDLKPENLFLAEPDESFIKILDFGISKFDAALTGVEGLTLEGSPMGTPYYMSPEQVRGQKNVDARADIYALGVVFYESLTARRPFDAETLPELILQIAQGHYLRLRELRPELPPAVEQIVQKAMALDPGQRFASAQEFSRAILSLDALSGCTEMMSAVPAIATPPPPLGSTEVLSAMTPGVFSNSSVRRIAESARPSKRRYKWVVGAALLALLVLGFGLWANGRAHTSPAPSGAALLPPASTALEHQGPEIAAPLARHTESSASNSAISGSTASAPAVAPSQSATRSPTSATAPTSRNLHTKSTTTSTAAVQTSRAVSQGLAQDNPFK